MHAALNALRRPGVLALCAAASGSCLLLSRNTRSELAVCAPTDQRPAAAHKGKEMACKFLHAIPKTDLHVHLDGSLRPETLIDLAKKHNVELPYYTVEELNTHVFKDTYKNLGEYLLGFRYTTAVMRHPEALERIAYEFAVDNYEENVHYFEVRFAPQLFASVGEDGMDTIEVVNHINEGLRRATEEYNSHPDVVSGRRPPYRYGIILCGMRYFDASFSPYYNALCSVHKHEPLTKVHSMATLALVNAAVEAKNNLNLPIVAIDIAGAEAGHPAKQHTDAFMLAHRNFIYKTVHAGEDYGPESIFQAITDLHAERIGHGYHIFSHELVDPQKVAQGLNPVRYVEELANYATNRRIAFEVCLTSNLQTMPWLRNNLQAHAFRRMLAHGMSVCLSTDNRLVSRTTVTRELQLAIETFQLSPSEVRNLVLEGFKRSFYPGPYIEKQQFLDAIFEYYEEIAKEHGVQYDRKYFHEQHAAHPNPIAK